jgi:hypothetical protein
MRGRGQPRRRSVDRGTCRLGIEPRKPCPAKAGTPGCRRRRSGRKATPGAPTSRGAPGPRAVKDPMHARRHLAREPGDPMVVCGALGHRPHREPQGETPVMNDRGKSDRPIVPRKPPNNARWPRRRWREGGWPRGIGLSKTRPGPCAGQARQVSLERMRRLPGWHVAAITQGRSPVR